MAFFNLLEREPAFTSEMFQDTLLPGSELWPVCFNKVNKMRSIFPETFMAGACFPNISQFPIPETLLPVSVFFPRCKLYLRSYTTREGILRRILAREQLQIFCEHEQASIHQIFASNSSKGQTLLALSNWMGPFNTPSVGAVSPFRPSFETLI